MVNDQPDQRLQCPLPIVPWLVWIDRLGCQQLSRRIHNRNFAACANPGI